MFLRVNNWDLTFIYSVCLALLTEKLWLLSIHTVQSSFFCCCSVNNACSLELLLQAEVKAVVLLRVKPFPAPHKYLTSVTVFLFIMNSVRLDLN